MITQTIINGLLLGGIYGLATIGFSMVWGVMGIINLAHGAYIMLGAYVAYVASSYWGIEPFLVVPIAMVLLFGLGYFIQRYLLNQVLKTSLLLSLALTFGINLILVDLVVIAFSSDFRAVTTHFAQTTFMIGDALIPGVRLGACILALVLAVCFHLFLVHTRAGQAILASALDREVSRLMGINPNRVYALTAGVGAALAGAAGVLSSMIFPVTPHLGITFLGAVFVITVLGGIGSLGGAILAGFVYGLIQAFASALLGVNYQEIVAFSVFLLILIVRPQGLLGKKFFGEGQ